MNQPKPVVIMNSVLAGLGVILGGAALAEYLDIKLVGLLVLIHAGVTLGWGTYVNSLVTPFAQTFARKLPTGEIISGPGAEDSLGIPTGTEVDVVRSEPPMYQKP